VLAANPISWLTISIVMPSVASCRITASTSPTTRDRAPMSACRQHHAGPHRQRAAIATRCFWPPERASSDSAQHVEVALLGVPPAHPLDMRSASVTLASAVHAAKRFKCWKNMPTELRTSSLSRSPACAVLLAVAGQSALDAHVALVVHLEKGDAAQERALAPPRRTRLYRPPPRRERRG
jgi:hypothetical protein